MVLKLWLGRIYLPCSAMFEGGEDSCSVWMLLIAASSLEADIAGVILVQIVR